MPGKSNLRAYLAILGGMLVHLSLGTIYTMGNMIPYMVSYLRIHSQSKNLRNTGAIWIQSAALTGQAVGMAISGALQLKFSTRVTTIIGGCVMSCGVAVTYFSINQSFWLMLFTYGFLFGVGLGIAYTPAFACAMKWLPAKKGLVTGLVQMGFGAGAFVFNQIQTLYINPDNFTPDQSISDQSNEKYFTQSAVLDRVPTCFLMLAGSYAGLQILGCCLISDPPPSQEDLEVPSDEEDSDSTTTTSFSRKSINRGEVNRGFVRESVSRDNGHVNSEEKPNRICPSTGEAVRPLDKPSPRQDRRVENNGEHFEILTSQSRPYIDDHRTTSSYSSTGEAIHLQKLPRKPTYTREDASESKKLPQRQYLVKEMIKTADFWKLYLTLLLNGQGTILVSSMYKAFGQTFIGDDHFLALIGSFSALFNSSGRPVWGLLADIFTYKIAMMFLCTFMCLFLFTFELTQLGGQVMFFVWVCAFYFSFCGNYSIMPACVSRTFGSSRVGINYSVVFTSQIITSVVSAVLASQLKDAIGWFGLFHVTGGLIFLSLLLTSVFNGRNPDDPGVGDRISAKKCPSKVGKTSAGDLSRDQPFSGGISVQDPNQGESYEEAGPLPTEAEKRSDHSRPGREACLE